MVWRREGPQGNEAAKVRYELLPYLGKTCLDLGCGPDKVFPHFIGLDSMKDTRLFGIPMKPDLVGDVERLTLFADGSFDTVFSSHTLEHIVDFRGALADWFRVVAVGGHMILYLPHRDLYPRIGTDGSNPDHKHDFAPEDIVQAMRELAPDWTLLRNESRDRLEEYSFLQVYRREAPGYGQADVIVAPAEKRAAVVRLGAYGDALWAASLLPHLKREGYDVTVYTERQGAEVLAADPHIDRIIEVPHQLFDDTELILYFVWESLKYQRWFEIPRAVEQPRQPHPNQHAYNR
jgi:SAM-dependent methyltransferase